MRIERWLRALRGVDLVIYGTRFIEPRNASVSGSTRGYCNFFSIGALHILGSEPYKDFRPYHKSNLHDKNKEIECKKALLELASITMYPPWLWKKRTSRQQTSYIQLLEKCRP